MTGPTAQILSYVTALLIAITSIPVIIKVSDLKNLYDQPDQRKLHTRKTPALGGIGIFAGLIMSLLFFGNFVSFPQINVIACAVIIMFFTGLKDDILVISPFKKFMSQFFAALLLVTFGHFEVQNFYGFLGIHELPFFISHGISIIFIIAIINGFNLIDGIDGLCGTIGVIVSITFGSIFLLHNDPGYALLAFSLAGALSGFLFFNFPPARIFMGDTGSLIVGLVCSLLAIHFLNTNGAYHNSPVALQAPVAVIFGIMIVPIFDTLRVFTIRIAKGRSPFSPDRNHLHHMIIDSGMSHLQATITLALLNLSFVLMVFYLNFIGNLYLIILSLSLILLFCSLFRYIRNKRERTLHQQHPTV